MEFIYLQKAYQEKKEYDWLEFGIKSYYLGVSSQMDLKKVNYKKWINQFRDKNEVEKEIQTEVEYHKNLLKLIKNKNGLK